MTPARELLTELTADPDLVAGIADDELLLLAGVNSGDIVRLTLALEEILGSSLSPEIAEQLSTIADIDAILARSPRYTR